MTYAFRIKFKFCEGDSINASENSIDLPIQIKDQKLRLRAVDSESIKDATALTIGCGGFSTRKEAESYGIRVKDALSLSGALLRRGIDVGKEKTLTGAGQVLKDEFKKRGYQLIDDVHGLSIYRDDIETKVITAHPPSILVAFSPDRFLTEIERAYELSPHLTQKAKIAFDLHNSSYFEASPNARFLTLISVVEVLSITEDLSHEVITLIDEFIRIAKGSSLSSDEKSNLISRIGGLKKQSVSSSARSLVNQYLGDEHASFFAKTYDIRSGLLHDGVLRCNEQEFRSMLNSLTTMVSDLLIKVVQSESA